VKICNLSYQSVANFLHCLLKFDVQYSGSTPAWTKGAAQPSPAGTSSEPKQAPFREAAGALLAVMLGVWMWKHGKKV
jgi:hypothetical protein